MKRFVVAFIIGLVSVTAAADEKIVLNYSQDRQDFVRLVNDVTLICMNANRSTLVNIENGILSKRSKDGLRDDEITKA